MARYFYTLEGRSRGPATPRDVMDLILADKLTLDSYVQKDRDPAWRKISEIPELVRYLHESEFRLPAADLSLEGFVAAGDDAPVYFHIPLSRLILGSLVSLGLYGGYWFYKNWNYLHHNRKGKTGSSFWRDSLNPMAIVNVFYQISVDKELNSALRAPRDFSGYGTLWLIFVLASVALFFFGGSLPGFLGLFLDLVFYLLPLWFLLRVQSYVNAANAKLGRRYTPVSLGHYVVLVVGAMSAVYWLTSLFRQVFSLFKLLS